MTAGTVRRLLALCEEVGDCKLWPGATNDSGAPYACINGRSTFLRRLVREARHGATAAGLLHVTTCGHANCLEDKHIAVLTKRQNMARLASAGIFSTPARKAAVTAGRRASSKQIKLTLDLARAIRQDPRKAADVAAALGVSKGTVDNVRQNRSWREQVSGASVFPT